jgi:hypothetical protein
MHPSSNNCHRKQNPSKKKKTNKGPGSLTDTQNKTQKKKKKKNKGPGSLTDTENKTHQKKKKKQTNKQRSG